MNDLDRARVDPFQPEIAKGLVIELFRSQGFPVDDDAIEPVLKEVELFVTFFLQLLVSATCKLARDRKEKISPTLISEAYRDRVINVESRTYFEHFHSRLKDYYEPDQEQAAQKMLKQLALKKSLTIRDLRIISLREVPGLSDDVFNHLLGDLENDFYLRRQDDSYIFHTKILRDWWLRFYSY